MPAILSRLKRWQKALLSCIALAAVVLAVWLVSAAMDPYDCRIVEGVSIGGVDVGGMTRSEARKALNAAAEDSLLAQPLLVKLPVEILTLSPEDTHIKLKTFQAVKAAYQIGREDSAPAAPQALDVIPYLSLDEEFIQTTLENYAAQYDTALSESHYTLDSDMPDLSVEGYDPSVPCPTLNLTLGTPEAHLDIQTTLDEILAAYNCGFSVVEPGSHQVTISVTPEALPQEPDLDTIYEAVCVQPADDTLDMQTFAVIPGSYGCVFDLDAAKTMLETAEWGQTISIPMEYAEPDILGEEVYFQTVLGSCQTKHTDDENRNTNLRLVCEILNGLVLQPGEEFSYNGVIGERTEERGFKSAGAYSGNRLVKDIGGGVCQGSTTLYNCVLLADLEVTERVCHGFTVNYVPIGLDAAVNWATNTDFKFRNNFNFPIKIQAEVSGGYMKMQILGTDEKDYYIEMKSGYSEEELRIYANSYKYKYDKETGELISKDLEARSSYMYYTG